MNLKNKIKLTTKLSLAEADLIYDILWDAWANLIKPGLSNAENFEQIYKTRCGSEYKSSQIYTVYYAIAKRRRKLSKKYDTIKEKEFEKLCGLPA